MRLACDKAETTGILVPHPRPGHSEFNMLGPHTSETINPTHEMDGPILSDMPNLAPPSDTSARMPHTFMSPPYGPYWAFDRMDDRMEIPEECSEHSLGYKDRQEFFGRSVKGQY
jgi:hypothetical protein